VKVLSPVFNHEPLPMLRRNILIFHSAALGDFVLTWPLALSLGRLYPQSRIIYVTQSQKGALAERCLRVETTDIEAGWHHLHGDGDSLPEAARRRLEGAHSIFSFVAGDANRAAANRADSDQTIAGRADAHRAVANSPQANPWLDTAREISPQANILALTARPPVGFTEHATQYLLQGLSPQSAVKTAMQQILSSIASNGVSVPRPADRRDILIHPGAGAAEKCWPVENYLRLIDRLRSDGNSVRIILGEVELDRWPASVITALESAGPVVRPATYLKLLEELTSASVMVGNDSGPAHLAGFVGVRTLAIFGPTDSRVWRPLGPRVNVLQSNQPLAALDADAVYRRLRDII